MTVSGGNNFIYSVNKNSAESKVSSFVYSPSSGQLDFINLQNSIKKNPCYIINNKKNVFVANYSNGNSAVFGKKKESGISEAKQVIQYHGKRINTLRQEALDVNMTAFSPNGKFILSDDLGNDKVYFYQYNSNADRVVLKLIDSFAVEAGSGPRHLACGKNGT